MLPNDGGILDQDEQTINRLMTIYDHLEEWREIEMDKRSKSQSTEEHQSFPHQMKG